MENQKHIDNLGYQAKDKITGAEGVIDSVSFDLYGCVQYVLRGKVKADGEVPNGTWFDSHRLVIISDNQVMNNPFVSGKKDELKGPAQKPVP